MCDLIAGQRYVGSHSWTEIGWGFLAGQRDMWDLIAGAEICGIS
jgi:hypothetical protein